ncbi:MAG: phosphotransferase [Paracoccaceae bacterium]
MTGRERARAVFLEGAGWGGAKAVPVAADASARRFFRLKSGRRRAILMDDPGEGGGSAEAFIRIADWLRGCGYSAPAILAADAAPGLLLVEDLGDSTLSRLAEDRPAVAARAFVLAADFLADLHRRSPPKGLTCLDGTGLAALTEIAEEWYAPGTGVVPPEPGKLAATVARAWERLAARRLVFSLRDFFPGNLMWLPARKGVARLGLLDFQDAVLAHPAYDLVSFVQDARRDLPAEVEARVFDRYLALSEADPGEFAAASALMGAQRAIRIMGVFSRLALRDGRTGYLAHLPRVWRHLRRNLGHPSLTELREAVDLCLSAPDAAALDRLASGAGRHPKALMLFAAGFGTRMGPLVRDRPKPLIPVAGRALIDHALAQSRSAGVERVVVNLHYLGGMIRNHLGDGDPRIRFSDESARILETGGGLRMALPLLGPGPVFTLNTDAVWDGANPLSVLRAHWRPETMGALLLLVGPGATLGHQGGGDFRLAADGRLTRRGDAIYTGAQIIDPTLVSGETEPVFSLNRIWDRLAEEGRLFGVLYRGRWCDVGQPQSIALAERMLAGAGHDV